MGTFTEIRAFALLKGAKDELARFISKQVPIDCAEFTDPAAAGAATLKVATATVASVVVLGPSDLLTAGKAALAAYPRRVQFTTAGGTPADAPATATIVGKDVNGDDLTETVTLAQTAAAAASAKFFAEITSITYPVADGTDATIAIGFTTALGFSFEPKARASGLGIVQELTNGAVPGTASTFITPAAGAPYGGFTPNTAADGSNDYAIYMERA